MELGELADEQQPDMTVRTGAVLGQADIGPSTLVEFHLGIRHFLAVQEHDRVCVLLDRAGFTKVAQLRSLVGAGLESAAQLAECHHGDAELTGEQLESSADLGDLELTVLDAVAAPAHELQVVDDDERGLQCLACVDTAQFLADL